MPALKNQRHERFVQELRTGKSQIEAYTLAGYKPHDGNAATLFGKLDIQARLAELAERVSEKTDVTAAALTEHLMRLARVAEKTGVIIDEETGEAKASSPKHLSVSRQAVMDVAKLNGLITDKLDHGVMVVNLNGADADL